MTLGLQEQLKKKGFLAPFKARSVNFKMSFWCHRLDQLPPKNSDTSRDLGRDDWIKEFIEQK